MRVLLVGVLVLLSAVGRSFSAEIQAAQWIVVAPPAFRAAAQPLVEHRRQEGLQASEIVFDGARKTDGCVASSSELRTRLESIKKSAQGPMYVLVIGVPASSDEKPDNIVPACMG